MWINISRLEIYYAYPVIQTSRECIMAIIIAVSVALAAISVGSILVTLLLISLGKIEV
jgi:hypothetical protein